MAKVIREFTYATRIFQFKFLSLCQSQTFIKEETLIKYREKD